MRVADLFRPHRRPITVALAASVAGAGLAVVPAFLLRSVVDGAIPNRDDGRLAVLAAGIVAAGLAVAAVGHLRSWAAATLAQSAIRDLRVAAHATLRRRPASAFAGTPAGEAVRRVVSEPEAVEPYVETLAGAADDAAALTATMAAMFVVSPRLALVALAALPVAVMPARRLVRSRRERAARRAADRERLRDLLEERLDERGASLARMYGRDRDEEARFRAAAEHLASSAVADSVAGGGLGLAFHAVFAAVPALAWLVAGRRVGPGAFTIGGIVAFTTLQARLFLPAGRLLDAPGAVRAAAADLAVAASAADAAVEPAAEEPATPANAGDAAEAGDLPRHAARGRLVFEDVTVSGDEGSPALDRVSFEILPGRTLAVVGASAATRAALAGVVCSLRRPDAGAVLLDGRPIEGMRPETASALAASAGPDAALLRGSVRENLRYANPAASDRDVEAAAKAAGLHARVLSLPQGYDTPVGTDGFARSADERYRVALARAILRDPRVLVLDETAGSSASPENRRFRDTVDAFVRSRTTLAIAARPETLHHADGILVLDRGRVVEQGTHHELIERGGAYARLYRDRLAGGPRLGDVIS